MMIRIVPSDVTDQSKACQRGASDNFEARGGGDGYNFNSSW